MKHFRPLEMKNTACKSRTINPVWKETFVLDVAENVEEILHVDVWNFMPDEKLREKLRKINDVRDSKGNLKFRYYEKATKFLLKTKVHCTRQTQQSHYRELPR